MEGALLPCGTIADTGTGTTGEAYLIPDGSTDPYFPALQARIKLSADGFVGWGDDNSPSATPPTNAVKHFGTAEKDYWLPAVSNGAMLYLWIYAASATISIDIQWMG